MINVIVDVDNSAKYLCSMMIECRYVFWMSDRPLTSASVGADGGFGSGSGRVVTRSGGFRVWSGPDRHNLSVSDPILWAHILVSQILFCEHISSPWYIVSDDIRYICIKSNLMIYNFFTCYRKNIYINKFRLLFWYIYIYIYLRNKFSRLTTKL